jgi:hypothetical protein
MQMAGEEGLLLSIAVPFVLLAIYFITTIIAHRRKHRQVAAIALINLFLGWTLLGWVGALVWSVLKDKEE